MVSFLLFLCDLHSGFILILELVHFKIFILIYYSIQNRVFRCPEMNKTSFVLELGLMYTTKKRNEATLKQLNSTH